MLQKFLEGDMNTLEEYTCMVEQYFQTNFVQNSDFKKKTFTTSCLNVILCKGISLEKKGS